MSGRGGLPELERSAARLRALAGLFAKDRDTGGVIDAFTVKRLVRELNAVAEVVTEANREVADIVDMIMDCEEPAPASVNPPALAVIEGGRP